MIFDTTLSSALVEFYTTEKATSVVNFGDGMGDYVKDFKKNNITSDGYDFNPNTTQFDKPYDWVMSLDIGEHLPCEFEDIFINNLHNNNNHGIVLSWAIKTQEGVGHLNEQNNDYIKSKICKLGYINDIDNENKLRDSSSLPRFKKTIMVFRKFKNTFPSINFDLNNVFLHGWFQENNILTFDFIINNYSIKNMCELGSWFGLSSKYFCSELNGKLYCIDLWYNNYIINKEENKFIDDQYCNDDKLLLKDRNLYSTFLNNLYEFKNTVVPIRTNTISGIELLYNQQIPIDLFYIDANHTYDSVKQEILIIKEKYPCALIFGDDYSFPGVKQAVNELAIKFNDIELVINYPCWFYKPRT